MSTLATWPFFKAFTRAHLQDAIPGKQHGKPDHARDGANGVHFVGVTRSKPNFREQLLCVASSLKALYLDSAFGCYACYVALFVIKSRVADHVMGAWYQSFVT